MKFSLLVTNISKNIFEGYKGDFYYHYTIVYREQCLTIIQIL